MSNYDPKEMVKFGDRDVSLWTAVRDIMSSAGRDPGRDRRVPRAGKATVVLRGGGYRKDRTASGLQRAAAITISLFVEGMIGLTPFSPMALRAKTTLNISY